LIENVQRSDLNAIEEARAYERLQSDGYNQTDIGVLIGKSQSYVAHKLRLLNAPAPLRFFVSENALSELFFFFLLVFIDLHHKGAVITGWEPVAKKEVNVEALAYIYSATRPEGNPQIPLWRMPVSLIERDFDRLLRSWRSMTDYVTNHNPAYQWVLTAWWFGAAVTAFEPWISISVALLGDMIDG